MSRTKFFQHLPCFIVSKESKLGIMSVQFQYFKNHMIIALTYIWLMHQVCHIAFDLTDPIPPWDNAMYLNVVQFNSLPLKWCSPSSTEMRQCKPFAVPLIMSLQTNKGNICLLYILLLLATGMPSALPSSLHYFMHAVL